VLAPDELISPVVYLPLTLMVAILRGKLEFMLGSALLSASSLLCIVTTRLLGSLSSECQLFGIKVAGSVRHSSRQGLFSIFSSLAAIFLAKD
jgi:hypothetical protein